MTSPHGHGADGETYRPGSPLVLVWDTGSRAYPPAAAGLGTSMQSQGHRFFVSRFLRKSETELLGTRAWTNDSRGGGARGGKCVLSGTCNDGHALEKEQDALEKGTISQN